MCVSGDMRGDVGWGYLFRLLNGILGWGGDTPSYGVVSEYAFAAVMVLFGYYV